MQTQHNGSGIGFFGLLAISFIILKLTGHITWSWVWVLCPVWLGFIGVLGIVMAVFAFTAVIKHFDEEDKRKKQ